tara:strand:+ start:634 stop:1614 length:981 start_codon:yes stop_codon:yes gene_type:complete
MKKILIFSNGEKMGDGLIKLPFIYEIFTRFPNCNITWVAYGTTVYSSSLKKMSENYLYQIIDKAELKAVPWKKISKKFNFEKENYDIIIDTQKTVIKTLALKRIKTNIFISSAAAWMFSDLKPVKKTNKKRYYLDNLYEMLELVLKTKIEYKQNYSFDSKLEEKIEKIFFNKHPCIGIAPGAGEKNRQWKIENFLEVSKYFLNKGFNIAFFVGPDDEYEKKIIIQNIPQAFFPEDLIDNFLGPEIVMCSTKYLKCSLSNDTGTGHMLSTNLCPQLKLFCKYDPIKFTPKSNIIRILSSQEYNSDNINLIPVKDVIENIENLISITL